MRFFHLVRADVWMDGRFMDGWMGGRFMDGWMDAIVFFSFNLELFTKKEFSLLDFKSILPR